MTTTYFIPRCTLALIGICFLVAVTARYSPLLDARSYLYFASSVGDLSEIKNGEWWRLLTPVFIHFGYLHLLLNMAWLWMLGGLVEKRWGMAKLIILVVVIGITSNASQYLVSGPGFGGMSGVLYGLLGYLWMHSRFNPASGVYLAPPLVMMMLAWLVLGWSGVLGVFNIHIANTAHTAGLIAGLVPGFIVARLSATHAD